MSAGSRRGAAGARRPVLAIGLDGATPELVFGRYARRMPVLAELAAAGAWGPLRSVHPPVTLPAWTAMLAGRDPGELGLHGFRTRRSRAERFGRLNDASRLPRDTLWRRLEEAGGRAALVGLPQAYPPGPYASAVVAGMLAPEDAPALAWPPPLDARVRELDPPYAVDVPAHRALPRPALLERLHAMVRARFALARELARGRPDFLFVHEIALDRAQHALLGPALAGDEEADAALAELHAAIDRELASLLELAPEEATVLVPRTTAARPFEGAFALAEWLLERGDLVLDGPRPPAPVPLERLPVRWERTRAWAEGGYAGRIYVAVRGRDPEGTLEPREAERFLEELAEELLALEGPGGRPLASQVVRPEEVYARVEGVAPDLLVYPGDLRLRCLGTVGHGRAFVETNDGGRDTANHAWEGVFVLRDPEVGAAGRLEGRGLLDVAPTLARALGVPAEGFRGGTLAP